MWKFSILTYIICLVFICTPELVDQENGIYKNSRGQCYINTCANCRDGGCCAEIVPCSGTPAVSQDEEQKVHKNSRGLCYYRTCKNCRDGGCCSVIVPCYE
uniref:Ixodegrin protein n=1 Tax=Meloidogyne hapla TaxID=6305 RepID=A0A1I8AYF3_MELHA